MNLKNKKLLTTTTFAEKIKLSASLITESVKKENKGIECVEE
jgi:hypothetical protein